MAEFGKKEVESRLNAIARLRLLFNTATELNGYVGFNAGANNSLSRIGGDNAFIKGAVYDKLCHDVKEIMDIDFDKFLTDYQEASEFFERKNLKWLSRRHFQPCYDLLKHAYRGMSVDKIEDRVLATLVEEIYDPEKDEQKINVPVLILLALQLLPLYSKGRGDIADPAAAFEKLLSFLEPMMSDNKLFTINQVYQQWKEAVTSGEADLCRLNLYCAFSDIMENYVNSTDNKALYLTNLDIQSRVEFPMNDRIWSDGQGLFWRFEKLDNGYFATQYSVDSILQTIRWSRYEMIFYRDSGGLYVYVISPKGILKVLKGKKLSNSDAGTFAVSTDGNDGKRTFSPVSSEHCLDIRELADTGFSFEDFQTKFNGFKYIDRFPESTYVIVSQIAAITQDHVYVPDETGRYYKIEKDRYPVLRYASVNDNGGLYEIPATSERFIIFVDQGIYIDVTSPASAENKGVRLVAGIIL